MIYCKEHGSEYREFFHESGANCDYCMLQQERDYLQDRIVELEMENENLYDEIRNLEGKVMDYNPMYKQEM